MKLCVKMNRKELFQFYLSSRQSKNEVYLHYCNKHYRERELILQFYCKVTQPIMPEGDTVQSIWLLRRKRTNTSFRCMNAIDIITIILFDKQSGWRRWAFISCVDKNLGGLNTYKTFLSIPSMRTLRVTWSFTKHSLGKIWIRYHYQMKIWIHWEDF